MSTGRTSDPEERDQDLENLKSNKKSKTPLLDIFGRDLNALAKEGKLDPVIGREKEIEKTIQILSKRKKANAVLVGEPGCVLPDTIIRVRKKSDDCSHEVKIF